MGSVRGTIHYKCQRDTRGGPPPGCWLYGLQPGGAFSLGRPGLWVAAEVMEGLENLKNARSWSSEGVSRTTWKQWVRGRQEVSARLTRNVRRREKGENHFMGSMNAFLWDYVLLLVLCQQELRHIHLGQRGWGGNGDRSARTGSRV